MIVHLVLSEVPTKRWIELFTERAKAFGDGVFTRDPVVRGAFIEITPTDDSLEPEVKAVTNAVHLANASRQIEAKQGRPESQPIPGPPEANVVQEGFSPKVLARIDAARRKARHMSTLINSMSWLAVDMEKTPHPEPIVVAALKQVIQRHISKD